ncbi:tRNA lysidine(34) synthetase TilS [Rhizobium mesoamericanum]|uniref:tRNA lysidine(34) synthetase TilS n=1 Tax=Rhizobium mesoamericanum TaxID=1079800 RepID=UPI0004907E18|nr:tRNA lysidine(34) synthetase TilS [Rhizobium mesoamericanum]
MHPVGPLLPETAVRRFLDSLIKPTCILVAISGGSDSTGLLLALVEALKAIPNSSMSLCAVTVDHALRTESADEAHQVAAFCRSLEIPHLIKVWQGEKPKAGMMAAARDARYALLSDAAENMNADIVVTAHTADDQHETLAMRRERSEQPSIGIADLVLFDRRLWIARPLLGCRREAIRDYLRARHVAWIDDPSNEDLKYERVRIRSRLKEGNIVANTDGAGELRSGIATLAARWLEQYFVFHSPWIGLVVQAGLVAETEILSYAVARLAAVFGGQPFALSRKQTEDVLAFIRRAEPGRMTAGRVVFDLRRDGLFLGREDRGILPLTLATGERDVWDGRLLIENAAPTDIGIVAGRAEAQTTHLPKGVVRRALATAPRIVDMRGHEASAKVAGKVRVTPYFSPFDRFLTRFDFIFAQSLAAAFGARPYPKPPLGLIDGKSI